MPAKPLHGMVTLIMVFFTLTSVVVSRDRGHGVWDLLLMYMTKEKKIPLESDYPVIFPDPSPNSTPWNTFEMGWDLEVFQWKTKCNWNNVQYKSLNDFNKITYLIQTWNRSTSIERCLYLLQLWFKFIMYAYWDSFISATNRCKFYQNQNAYLTPTHLFKCTRYECVCVDSKSVLIYAKCLIYFNVIKASGYKIYGSVLKP